MWLLLQFGLPNLDKTNTMFHFKTSDAI